MSKHKARMTDRRHQILRLIAKGFRNEQIAAEMKMSLSNTKLQKWRLYCHLGEIHTSVDAVYMGLQMGLLKENDLSEQIREEIYGSKIKKQMYCNS